MHARQLWLAGAAVLLGTTCQGPHRGRARALVLDHGRDEGDAIRILAFGDSYAAFAPGAGIFKKAFARYNKTAKVYNGAVSGTTSCQWAQNTKNLLTMAEWAFPMNGPDYVWVSLGGNDLELASYRACAARARTFKEAKDCVTWRAKEVGQCQADLVNTFFAGYPFAKVIYSGYDFSCASSDCLPMARWPYCGNDIDCFQDLYRHFQDTIRELVAASAPAGRYIAINIEGTLQQAAGWPATPGHPIQGTGAPCSLLLDCHHPKSGGAAAWFLGEAFMVNFFNTELHLHPHHLKPPTYNPVDTHLIGYDSDDEDVVCNEDWAPNLEDPACSGPPCNRGESDCVWPGDRPESPVSEE